MNQTTLPATKHYLQIKWTVSHGRETYGYNICSLYVDGIKTASCNGGGYDMEGTVLGDYIANQFQNELKHIDTSSFYGLSKNKEGIIYIDGACGWRSVNRIIEALGLELTHLSYKTNGNNKFYLLENK